MSPRLLCAVTLAAACAFANVAARADPAQPAPRPPRWAAAESALAALGDAQSLASAAALRFGQASPDALDLAAQAAKLDPENSAIAWLRLQICTRSPGCDVRGAATDMRWADADNGAAWLPTLATAQWDHDREEVDRVLGGMARTLRFDLYWNRLIVMVVDSLARADAGGAGVSTDRARLDAAQSAIGRIVPAFRSLYAACREGADADRRENCRRLARTMQRSDTVAAQLAGLGLERRLAPPDGRDARLAAERRRVLEWRVAQIEQWQRPLLPWSRSARARKLLARMRVLPRQEDVYLAMLREHRIATEPPEDQR